MRFMQQEKRGSNEKTTEDNLYFSGCDYQSAIIPDGNNVNFLFIAIEFDDYAEIVDDDPDYAHPMAGTMKFCLKCLAVYSILK